MRVLNESSISLGHNVKDSKRWKLVCADEVKETEYMMLLVDHFERKHSDRARDRGQRVKMVMDQHVEVDSCWI